MRQSYSFVIIALIHTGVLVKRVTYAAFLMLMEPGLKYPLKFQRETVEHNIFEKTIILQGHRFLHIETDLVKNILPQ
jgi:hypothetical protein